MTETTHGPVTYESVEMTPELADEWITQHNVHNRDVRDWKVRMIQRSIEKGRYLEGGENGVTFDWDGNLAGGQHTLYAVRASGRTVRMRLTRNVDPAVRDVLNDSLKESFADRLRVAGVRNSKVAEALTRRIEYYLEHGGLIGQGNAKYAKSDLMDVWPKYAQPVIDTLEATVPYDNKNVWPGNRGAMHFTWWLLVWHSKSNTAAVKEFFDLICYGTQGEEGLLFHRLRGRMKEYISADYQMYFILKAWNAWSKGEKLTHLQAPRDSISPVTKKMVLTNKHFPKVYRAR